MTGSPKPAGRPMRIGRASLLLAGAVVAWLCGAAPAAAQFPSGGHRQRAAPVSSQADEVQYDDQLGLTIAKGHVEISQGGEVLLADQVGYNQRTDTITASGHVSLLSPTGEIVFSDFIELRDSMNNAFAQNVRMLLADRSRLAANTARRIAGNRTELRRGIYSPCDLCRDNPSAPPAGQLKARESSDDKEYKLLEFRDVVMEIDGWPVFYAPYMSQPEPGVKRASGFLMPSFGNSNTNGFHFGLPYFWAIDVDKDLTLGPRFYSRAGPLLAAEYRQRFGNGVLDALGSLNYSNVGANGDTSIDHQLRGHVNASGVWDLDPTYRTGFQVQRVSDQTYLLRFGFGVPLLNAMISRAYLEGFQPNAMTDINGYMFQPLTPGLGDSTQPIVMPVANRYWVSEPDSWGGRWRLNANLLNIVREVGTQTRRLSLGRVSDKDSLGFEFRDSDLFRPDRLAGYDVLDTGQRVDYGLKLGVYHKDTGNYRVLIGQSYRAQVNPFLPPGSGAETRLSDVVGRVVMSPSSYLDLVYRFRLSKSDLSNKASEVGINAGPQSLRVGANFLLLAPQQQSELVTNPIGQSILFGKREQITFSTVAKLTRYWSLTGSETLNLSNSTNFVNGIPTPHSTTTSLYATVAGIYQDECMAFIASVTQSGIRSGDVTPGISVMFSIVFKNLGEIGGTVLSTQGSLL